MPPEVVYYINHYGYLAIFILIFLQEIGVPNPIPNELVLLFSGYLVYSGVFKFYDVIFVAVLADFTGTNILYFVFKAFGNQILKIKPRWIPISQRKIDSLSRELSNGGLTYVFVCRLTPFIRGYTSVISGLLQIKVFYFLPIAFFSASAWASAYTLTGWLLGPWWKQLEASPHLLRNIMFTILTLMALFFTIRLLLKRTGIRWKS
jgi:membrane protein DedA with SNARE-associated domain